MKKQNVIILVTLIALLLGFIFIRGKQEGIADKEDTKTTHVSLSEIPDIRSLTDEKTVVNFLRKEKKLPDYYITKSIAKQQGWVPSQGNLCEVLPGRAIGGDVFSNRQKKLPKKKGRTWFEADINYNCGRRDADRIVFSDDGMIYVSYDHYKNFERR